MEQVFSTWLHPATPPYAAALRWWGLQARGLWGQVMEGVEVVRVDPNRGGEPLSLWELLLAVLAWWLIEEQGRAHWSVAPCAWWAGAPAHPPQVPCWQTESGWVGAWCRFVVHG